MSAIEGDLNFMLGRILAEQGSLKDALVESQRQRDAILRKLDEVQKEIHEYGGAAKAAVAGVAEINGRIEKEIMPHVDDYKKLKQRGFGVIAIIGLASSSLSAFVTNFLTGNHPS